MTKDTAIPPRLRWACRRGMLELDVLLGNFLEEVYVSLSEKEQQIFRQLLDFPDPDLFLYLTAKETMEDTEFAKMIEKIRAHAEKRHSS